MSALLIAAAVHQTEDVQDMNEVSQFAPLSMGWCVNCHRETNVQFNDDKGNGNQFYSIYEKFHDEISSGKYDSVTVEKIGGTVVCQIRGFCDFSAAGQIDGTVAIPSYFFPAHQVTFTVPFYRLAGSPDCVIALCILSTTGIISIITSAPPASGNVQRR